MVAIVSGNSLGLSLTSFATLGQRGAIGLASQGRSSEQAFVNIATGNLILQSLDDRLLGPGPDVVSVRTYNSQGQFDDDNGDNWTVGAFGQRVQLTGTVATLGSTLTRTDRDGAHAVYIWDASAQRYTSLAGSGAMDTIRYDAAAAQYIWTDGDTGLQEIYMASGQGRLLRARDSDGNEVTFSYNANGTVEYVKTAQGEITWYDYSGANLRSIRTQDADGNIVTTVTYKYDSSNRLASVQIDLTPRDNSTADGKVYSTSYTYDGASTRIASVTQTDGTQLHFTYVRVGADYKIQTVTDALGATTRFDYDIAGGGTTVTDPLGARSVYHYDAEGQLVQVRQGVTDANAAGLSQVSYAYDAAGNLALLTDGEGNKVVYEYDARGNLLKEVDAAGNTRVRTYNEQNQILTDTSYADAAVNRGAFSKEAELPETTRYVYGADGIKLRFVLDPQGGVTEYRYDAYGQRSTAVVYAGAVFGGSNPTEFLLNTWAAAQDLTRTQRTDYTYDGRGAPSSTIVYASVGADGKGNPVGASATYYVYDTHGRLIQQIDAGADGGVTDYAYDGLGRVIAKITPALDGGAMPNLVLTQYDDAGGKTSVILANGLSTVSAYDKAGRLVSVTQSGVGEGILGTTTYAYDNNGNLLMTQDPTGARQWSVYDEAGRKTADIDATGAVIEYVYNANGLLQKTIAYTNTIDTSTLMDGAGQPTAAGIVTIRPADHAKDQKVWRFYDSANRLTWQVDALGYVTQTTYDGASRILSVTQLARPIDVTELGNGTNVELLVDPATVGGVTLSVNSASASLGSTVTLTATIASANAAGMVTFFSGAAIIGSAMVVNGKATLQTTELPVGVNDIRAAYSGDADRPASVSPAVQKTITPAVTRAAMSFSPGTATLGKPVTLSVALTTTQPPRLDAATGEVRFYNGDTLLGVAIVIGGLAVLTVDDLPVGALTIRAQYQGDSTHATVAIQNVLTVTQAPTSSAPLPRSVTTLIVAPADVVQGQSVTLTAEVAGIAPGGLVSFFAGTTFLGTATVDDGQAMLLTAALPPGSNLISAAYGGDANNAGSVTTLETPIRVAAGASDIPPPAMQVGGMFYSSRYGQATISAGYSWPMNVWASGSENYDFPGNFSIFEGERLIACVTARDADGAIAFPSLPPGTHNLTVVYSGDANHPANTSTVQLVVTLPNSTAGVTASRTQTTLGTEVLLSIDLRARNLNDGTPYVGPPPTGAVTFYSNGAVIGVADVVNGIATLACADLPLGTHSIHAVYSGDASNAAVSSVNGTQVVVYSTQVAGTTTLASSQPSGVYGSPITVTAQVAADSGAPLRGTVSFYKGDVLVGTAEVVDGRASLTSSHWPAGLERVRAVYSGDEANATSVGAIDLPVAPATTKTTLGVSASTTSQGQPITLTAQVAGVAPGGLVSFFTGATFLGSATVVDGQASLVTSALPAGANIVSAAYGGDASNAGSVVTLGIPVQVAAGSASVAPPASKQGGVFLSSLWGGTTITTGFSWPMVVSSPGSVNYSFPGNFNIFEDGKLIASVTTLNAGQIFHLPELPPGTHNLTIVYSGDPEHPTSTSSVQLTVTPAKTNARVISSRPQSTSGSPLTLIADLTPARLSNGAPFTGQLPSGTVTFYSDGVAIGTANLINGIATLVTSSLPPGTHTINVVYSGDANHTAASSVNLTQQIVASPVTSATGLSQSPSTPSFGSSATFTATVTGDGKPDSGTVSFYDGATLLGTAAVVDGKAVFSIGTLSVGSHSIKAVYSGDANNAASTSAVRVVTVVRAPVEIANQSAGSIARDGALSVSVRGVGALTGLVSFYDGTRLLGTAQVIDGIATLSGVQLLPGYRKIAAVYAGDDIHADTELTFSQLIEGEPVTVVDVGLDLEQDRAITQFHDRDGRLQAVLDGEGYLTEYIYDAAGRLVETIRYANRAANYPDFAARTAAVAIARASYDLRGLRPTVSNSADLRTYNYWDAQGRLVGQVDGEDHLTETSYDARGNVVQIKRYYNPTRNASVSATLNALRPVGTAQDQVITQTWSAADQLLTRTNVEGTVTRYTYDKVGQLVESTVAAGTADERTQRYLHDLQGRLIGQLDGRGSAAGSATDPFSAWADNGLTHTYDAAGRRTSTTDANGHRTLFFYDAVGRLAYTVNAMGEVTESRYTSHGQLAQQVIYGNRVDLAPLGTATPGGLDTTVLASLLAAHADPARDTHVLYEYNATGSLAGATDALGHRTSYSYNAFREASAQTFTLTDGRVVTDTVSYDRRGLKTANVRDAAGLAITQRNVYDAFGRLTEAYDGNGNRTQLRYDRLGRIVESVDALGATRATTYDPFGRVLTQRDALGNTTTYIHDIVNGSVTVKTPEGVSTTTVRNRHGQIVSVTDGRGNTTAYTYDASGNLVQTDAALATAGAIYDKTGLLLETTDANGVVTRYTYDAADRLLTRTVDADGLALATTYAYDAKGQRISVTDPNGVVTATEYDLAGQVVSVSVDPDGLNLQTRYQYDTTGQVLRVTDPNGHVTQYTYDAAGRRVMEQVDPEGLNLATRYEYDGADNVVRAIDANGNATRHAYDAGNRLVYTLDPLGNVTQQIYDAEGRIVRRTSYAASINTAGLSDKPTVAQIQARVRATGGVDRSETYRYDKDGRLIYTVDGTGAVVGYTYDKANNLVETCAFANRIDLASWSNLATNPPVVADASRDQRIRIVYDSLNRATWRVDGAGGVTAYTYDAGGNLLETRAYANALSSSASKNWNGQTPPPVTADESRDLRIRTVYDSAGRATWTVDGAGNVAQAQYDANGNVIETRRYANALDAAALTAWDGLSVPPAIVDDSRDARARTVYDAGGRATWTVDGMGSVQGTTYDANGNIIQRRQYASPVAYDADPASVASTSADRATDYVYDAANRVRYQLRTASGDQREVTAYDYDGIGHLARQTAYAAFLPVGIPNDLGTIAANIALSPQFDRTTSMVYDTAGRLEWRVDAAGAVTRQIFDAFGNVTQRIEYANTIDATASPFDVVPSTSDRITDHAYDLANRPTFTVDALGGVTQADYDAFGNLTRRTAYANPIASPVAGTSRIDANLRGLVTLNASADRIQRYAYDNANRQVFAVDPLGAVTESAYDALGHALEVRQYARAISTAGLSASASVDEIRGRVTLDANSDRISRQTYDAAGRAQYSVDPLGYVTLATYDGLGQVSTTTRYALAIPASTANSAAAIAAAVSPYRDDRTEGQTYDAAGRVLTRTDAMGFTEHWTYNPLGEKTSYTNANGATWNFGYDNAGRLVLEVSPEVELTAVIAGADDRLEVDEAHSGVGRVITQMTYDAFGGLRSRTEAAGRPEERTTRYEYDRLGRQVRVIFSPVGVYDAAGDDITTNGASGEASRVENIFALFTETTYDAFGNAIANLDVGGNRSYKTYDLAGRLRYEIDALGYVTGYERNTFGDVDTLTRYGQSSGLADAQPASLSNEQVAAVVAGLDTKSNRALTTTYDRQGRAIEVVEGSAFVYDSSRPAGDANQYAYDAKTTRNTYDTFGNLVQVAQKLSGGTWSLAAYYYDKRGQQIASVDALGYITEQAFDGAGNLRYRNESANAIAGWIGTSDLAGWTGACNASDLMPTCLPFDRNDRSTAYDYDLANRKTAETRILVEFGTASGVRDLGNLTTTYGYDAVGNLTRTTDALGGTTLSFYDALGRVTSMVEPVRNSTESGAAIAPLTIFRRDAYGNVVVKTEYANGASMVPGLEGTPADPRPVGPPPTVIAVPNSEIAVAESLLWNQVPFAGYISDTPFEGSVPLYRLVLNGPLARHIYTSSEEERNFLLLTGWREESVSIVGYIAGTQTEGTVPLYRMQNNEKGFFSLENNPAAILQLQLSGWTLMGVVGYVPEQPTGAMDVQLVRMLNVAVGDNFYLAATVNQVQPPDLVGTMQTDRVTYARYDSHGHVIQSTDAMGVSHYSSYNMQGLLAKEWQDDKTINIDGAPRSEITVPEQGLPKIEGVEVGPVERIVGGNPVDNGWEYGSKLALHWPAPTDYFRVQYAMYPQGAQDYEYADPQTYGSNVVQGVDLDWWAPGVYEYHIVFKDFAGNTVRQATGTLTIPPHDSDEQPTLVDTTPPHIPAHTEPESQDYRTVYRAYEYDALGRQTHVFEPGDGSAGSLVDTELRYNAFGELIAKSVNGEEGEYFHYDNAGRLWRTNAGDGLDKVALYDLQGNQTAEIRSAGDGRGNLNLRGIDNADAVAAQTEVRRTDTVYDLLGRVVSQSEAERLETQGGGLDVRNGTLSGNVISTATWTPPSTDIVVRPGSWSGTNNVHLDWGNLLSGLGSGEVRVSVQYVSRDFEGNEGPIRDKHLTFTSAQASTGVDFAWQPERDDPAGGLSRVLSVTLEKKDQFGNWQTVFANAGFGALGESVYIGAPPAALGPAPGSDYPGVQVQLYLRDVNSPAGTGWFTAPLTNFGDGLRFDASGLPRGHSYEYEVRTILNPGEPHQVTAGGTLSITPKPLTVIGNAVGVDSAGQNLQWQGPGNGDVQILRLRLADSADAWIEQPIQQSGATSYVDLAGLAGGQYEYELLWRRPGETGPYAHTTGVFSKVPGTQGIPGTPPSGLPHIDGLTTELRPDGFGNFFVFVVLPPPPPGQTAIFAIGPRGHGAGMPLVITPRVDGRWEVNITNSLAPGFYDYSYSFLPFGGQPTAHASGDLTLNIFGAITLGDGTPPYDPGTPEIPGTPAQYSHAATYPGLYPISEDVWAGGRFISRTTTLDGTYGYQRPMIHQNVDRWGNVVSITDPRSAQWKTTYRYNANNQLIEQVQVGGLVTSVYYDALGRQVAVRDANGHVNGQEWDAGGQLVRELHADGGVVRHAYDAFGNRTVTVDAVANDKGNGDHTRYLYDKLDRLVRTDYNFHDGGVPRLIQEHQRWDAAGRLVSTTNGENETTRYAYDLRGNLVRTTLAMGQVTEYAYDAHNRKVFERDANGNTASWSYDYFGALTGHADIGGATYAFSYDNARQLTAQSNTRGQDQHYAYDAAGQLIRITDIAVGRITTYSYDLAGRHIRETTVQNGETYQDNHIAYDELGRMRWVADGRVTVTIDYDAVGNRKHVHTFVNDGNLVNRHSDSYYEFDAMNRQTKADGHTLEYDLNGNRIKDSSVEGVEIYAYDGLNRLKASLRNGSLTEERTYDNAHRVVHTVTAAGTRTNIYNDNGLLEHQDIAEPGSTWAAVNYDYDAVGNLKSTLVADLANGTIDGFSGSVNEYVPAGDGYQLKSSENVLQTLGELRYNYDANGHLQSTNNVYEYNGANRDHIFVNDAAGDVLYSYYLDRDSKQAVNAQRQMVVNGEVLGRYGDVATSRTTLGAFGYPNYTAVNYEAQADFSFGAQGINSQYPAGTPGSRVVHDGDTLRGIAQATYGNGALWYVIAEANGLASDADLVSGYVLKLPPVVDSANNVETFRPYDPSKVANDTPTGLPIPKDSGGGCGGIGQIIVIVVAIVVTVYTAGAAASMLAPAGSAAAATTGIGATMSLGASVLGGTAGLGAAGAAAAVAGGAVGSIVSQGVGVALGVQDSFSWKGVAMSAISAGATAGVGSALGTTGVLSGNGWQAVAGRAAISNTVTQGIAVATGLQSSFNWRSVAASAVGAGVGQAVAPVIGNLVGNMFGEAGSAFATRLATGLVAGTAAAVMRGGKVAIQQVAVDAFGNVIGDALARGSTSGGAGEKQVVAPMSASERQTIMGWFDEGPTASRVNGLTFSQDVALRQVEKNPYGLPTSPQAAATSSSATSLSNKFDDGAADFLEPAWANTVAGAYGSAELITTQYGGAGTQKPSVASFTAQDYKAQADKLMRDANQLQDAEQWARTQGREADANDYRTAAQKAFYASNAASMQALNMNVESSRNIPQPTSTSLFASGWNTGEYSAGTPYASGSRAPDYVSIQLNTYVASVGVAIDLHDAGVYGQWALGRQYPAYTAKPGLSIVAGSIAGGVGAGDTAEYLKGGSWAAGAFAPSPIPLIGVGGGVSHSYGGRTAVEIGVSVPPGAGVNPAGYGFELNNLKAK